MALAIELEAPPITTDNNGAIRVGNTRILLELVIRAFESGATPEEILGIYQTLNLADIYGVIAYYLRHKEDVQAYIQQQEKKAEKNFRISKATQGDLNDLRQRMTQMRQNWAHDAKTTH